jgi:hypothetical protein
MDIKVITLKSSCSDLEVIVQTPQSISTEAQYSSGETFQ